MSRLIDRLERVGQQAPTPFGFAAATRREESISQIMLIGRVNQDQMTDGKKGDSLSNAEVDSVLVSWSSWDKQVLERIGDALSDRLWGAQTDEIDQERAEQLKEIGCDFIVFKPETTAGAVLNDEDLGKVMALGSELTEEVARAIHDLSIDSALFSPKEEMLPLTVGKLIEIQKVRGLLDKPFLLNAPPDLEPAVLESLRNSGITGLVLELTSADAVASTKEAIADLPRRRPRPRSRSVPLVPQADIGFDQDEDDHEHEHEHDHDRRSARRANSWSSHLHRPTEHKSLPPAGEG